MMAASACAALSMPVLLLSFSPTAPGCDTSREGLADPPYTQVWALNCYTFLHLPFGEKWGLRGYLVQPVIL